MGKVIKLTESDLIRIVKKVLNETVEGLPVRPDGRLYSIKDWVDSTGSFKITDLPKLLNRKIGFLNYGESDDNRLFSALEDMKKTGKVDAKSICASVNKGGASPILYPMPKQGSPSVYPPAKYYCLGTTTGDTYLKLKAINQYDAGVIANAKNGINFLQTVDQNKKPYLVTGKDIA